MGQGQPEEVRPRTFYKLCHLLPSWASLLVPTQLPGAEGAEPA